MTIIAELKGLNALMGLIQTTFQPIGLPRKLINESIMVGLPAWDPPPELPVGPPDVQRAQRLEEAFGMGALQERESFNRIQQILRDIRDGQARQPARVERRLELPSQVPLRPDQTSPPPEKGP